MSKDTIDRQAAIDAYGDWYVEEGMEHGFIGTVKQLLEGLPSAEPPWIPCSERLPEVGETVLFCDYDGDIYVGHRAIEHWWSVDDKVKNVTAWMPLPNPWKGE